MRVAGGQATDNTEAFYVQRRDGDARLAPLDLTAGLRLTRNERDSASGLTPKFSAMLELGRPAPACHVESGI